MSKITLHNILSLRKIMTKHNIDVYVVPHHDENFSEYVPPNKERLRWASGFSGSAGTLLITKMNYTCLQMADIHFKPKIKQKAKLQNSKYF